ncbi:MAG: U32 family peptidase [Candidatus Methanomethylophilaceae archaeon]|nr:U32 family peptidase [Candidatus Methanomethylophilaceae archaeon]
MEILAPVGSPEALVAAIKGGCDAVYLAGKDFGARSFAKNFTDQELEGAVKYAHEHGVKVHVTVNTLVKNSEIEEAVSFVQFVKDIGADAVIIQDLGLLKAIERIPIAKHASTQMQIHSREGLEWCHRNGISRAVLARELTFDEIKEIVEDSPIETEVFVQGAMCYCMSGGCLFSSIVGGRSGNRGGCAQPCRKKYVSDGGREGYLMSNSDMYCIDRLKDLESIGVTSVKIEGRMRSPAYAHLTSKAYSTMLRDPGSDELESTIALLKTVFNRGYCEGYLNGVKDLVQSSFPDNRGQFLGTMEIKNRRFSTIGTDIGIKDGISFFQGDEKRGGLSIQNTGTCIIPFKIADGMYDVYRTYDPRIDTVKNTFGETPRFTGSMKRCEKTVDMPAVPRGERKCQLSFYVSSVKMIGVVLPYADRIYYDGKDIENAMKACGDKEFVYYLPRFTAKEPDVPKDVPVMVHNVGQFNRYNDGRRVYCSYICNMMNSNFPLDAYQTTLSVELSRREIREMAPRFGGRLEMMAFGRTELMYSRDPNMPSGTITDEKGFSFPVYRDTDGFVHILNSSDLMLADFVKELERYGIDSLGIDVRKRPAILAQSVGKVFRNTKDAEPAKLKQMCGGTFNTGHYLRGV